MLLGVSECLTLDFSAVLICYWVFLFRIKLLFTLLRIIKLKRILYLSAFCLFFRKENYISGLFQKEILNILLFKNIVKNNSFEKI